MREITKWFAADALVPFHRFVAFAAHPSLCGRPPCLRHLKHYSRANVTTYWKCGQGCRLRLCDSGRGREKIQCRRRKGDRPENRQGSFATLAFHCSFRC